MAMIPVRDTNYVEKLSTESQNVEISVYSGMGNETMNHLNAGKHANVCCSFT